MAPSSFATLVRPSPSPRPHQGPSQARRRPELVSWTYTRPTLALHSPYTRPVCTRLLQRSSPAALPTLGRALSRYCHVCADAVRNLPYTTDARVPHGLLDVIRGSALNACSTFPSTFAFDATASAPWCNGLHLEQLSGGQLLTDQGHDRDQSQGQGQDQGQSQGQSQGQGRHYREDYYDSEAHERFPALASPSETGSAEG